MTGERNRSQLPSCHDVCGLPAAVMPATCSIEPWHVIVFLAKNRDYEAFEEVLVEAKEQVPMRVLAWCVMPTHWHLAFWPHKDGDLAEFMRWMTVTHTQCWHAAHGTAGTGPLYQGRFKSFPIQEDGHRLTMLRYVEGNALPANLVQRAEDWRWSSLRRRVRGDVAVLDEGPVPLPGDWRQHVQSVQTEAELAACGVRWWRNAIWRGCLARVHGEASGLGVHTACLRSAAKISATPRAILRLPTRFSLLFRFRNNFR